ncbi:hypothetical protein MKZ38_001644 [Zalerion maritima]|uniref:Uncharacterized protein n=1 Tax=Zalerion maritima TaxID=339359 RepID=A0AAD5RRA2_9PEZI|nr:hypothetical protein MKZ38_001644 [Zalerion maritima]
MPRDNPKKLNIAMALVLSPNTTTGTEGPYLDPTEALRSAMDEFQQRLTDQQKDQFRTKHDVASARERNNTNAALVVTA